MPGSTDYGRDETNNGQLVVRKLITSSEGKRLSYRRCAAAYGKVEKNNKNTLTRRTSQPIAWAGLGVGLSFGKVSAISGAFKLVAVLDSSSEISSSRPATLPPFFPLLIGFSSDVCHNVLAVAAAEDAEDGW